MHTVDYSPMFNRPFYISKTVTAHQHVIYSICCHSVAVVIVLGLKGRDVSVS